MTVTATTPKVVYQGNDLATVFSFSFSIQQSEDLKVTHTSALGVETTLAEGTGASNYSISVSAYPGNGSITYPASGGGTLATGEALTIQRVVSITQSVALNNQGGYFPTTLESALDRSAMIDQQLQEQINRSIKAPASSQSGADFTLPKPQAGRVIGVWNSDASAIEIGPTASEISSAQGYAVTAQEKADAAAASAAEAAAAFQSFDVRYLGAKGSYPVADNEGNPLVEGALIWRTDLNDFRVFDGAVWAAFSGIIDGSVTAKKIDASATGILTATKYDITGSGDETAKLAAAIADAGYRTLDLEGKTITVSGAITSVPDGARIVNGTLLLDGDASQVGITIAGTQTAKTYTGGSISAGFTNLVNVSGLTAADAGKHLWIASNDLIYTGYKKGELVRIRSVSGTTVYFDGAVQEAYTTGITVALVEPKKDVLVDLAFVGDPAKTQGGVWFDKCENCRAVTRGANVGWYTVRLDRTVNCNVYHTGHNHGIQADNGLDYGVIHANGNQNLWVEAKGEHYRHVVAGGASDGIDYNTRVICDARYCKDAAVDCHAGVINYTVDVVVAARRSGGTFSDQPEGFTFQGGGYLKARVVVTGYTRSAVLLQPLQNSIDNFDLEVHATGAGPTALYGVFADIYKLGGFIRSFSCVCYAEDLTAVGSRAFYLDMHNAASGVTLGNLNIAGAFRAEEYGVFVFARAGKTIGSVQLKGKAGVAVAGKRGFYVGGSAAGLIDYVLFHGTIVSGVAGAIAHQCDSGVSVSKAVGTFSRSVGGAGIATYALINVTNAAGNSYT